MNAQDSELADAIRRDSTPYDDTVLESGPHIGIGTPVTQLPGWTADQWVEIRNRLEDAAQESGTLAAELHEPVIASLSPVGDDLKAELIELGWTEAPEAEPLENARAVIWWTRHDSGGDIKGSAIHLLNRAELEHVENDTLSIALDDVWDARDKSDRAAVTAVKRLCKVLERRGWRSPTTRSKQSQDRPRPTTDEDPITLDVGAVFTSTPGPRYRRQGPGSGEAFREEHLLPAVERAVKNDWTVIVDLSNVKYGCPVGWLEEVFGGARRTLGRDTVMRRIRITAGLHNTTEVSDAYAFLTEDRK